MKRYRVTLKKGTSEKSVTINATSIANAQYEAGRQNPGWVVKDVQVA